MCDVNNCWLLTCLTSALDRDGMKNGLRDATDLLLPTDNPVLVRARYLCYGVADDDFTVMELKHVVVSAALLLHCMICSH